jgi:acyl carrier protein
MKPDENQLLLFVRELIADSENITAHTTLFSTGLLDSVAMMSLINHIEELTGTQIGAHEVTLENFDTVYRMLEFLKSHD